MAPMRPQDSGASGDAEPSASNQNSRRRSQPGPNSQNDQDDQDDHDPSPFSSTSPSGIGNGSSLQRTSSRASRLSRNERRAARPSREYDLPANFRNLDDAFAHPPIPDPDDDETVRRMVSREDDFAGAHGAGSALDRRLSQASSASRSARIAARRRSVSRPVDYDVPEDYANLDEVAASPAVENPDESPVYERHSLEDTRSRDREQHRRQQAPPALGSGLPSGPAATVADDAEKGTGNTVPGDDGNGSNSRGIRVSRLATQIYTLSYLVLFSFFGTLARLGLQALTDYANAPVIFSSIWPNFAGSLVMGFLAEDRMLFRFEWGTPTYHNHIQQAARVRPEDNSGSGSSGTEFISQGSAPKPVDLSAAKKTYMATKKTIPLYIGLATGFCGSFTSFSAFIRDIFLALSNDMSSSSDSYIPHRNGGYSFMSVLAVIILTVSLSLSGLFIGAHLAIALEPITPSLPYLFMRNMLDRLAVFLAIGCWIGAILLSALPPDRNGGPPEIWRGRAAFSLVFAPLGCLARFYASLFLNGKIASFPLGTFVVNVAGTMILGMSWDLAHVPLGGVVGCQVLQGIEDGFCGCLTTVSTWVTELSGLRRLHSYIYGTTSVLVSLAAMVIIMGGLRWTDGFAPLQCVH